MLYIYKYPYLKSAISLKEKLQRIIKEEGSLYTLKYVSDIATSAS